MLLEYISIENGREKKKFIDSEKPCKLCGSKLNEKNWGIAAMKKRYYICKPCLNTRIRNLKSYKDKRTTETIKKIFDIKLSRKVSNFIVSCARRGIDLNISYSFIGNKMQEPCHYCGKESSVNSRNGIDRLDSFRNYTDDNVVACCSKCNVGKGLLSKEEYIEHCKNVYLRNMES